MISLYWPSSDVETLHCSSGKVFLTWRSQTCAFGEVRNVRVLENLRVLDHLGQTSQTRTAHDSHDGTYLRLGHEPVSGGSALLIAHTGDRQNNDR